MGDQDDNENWNGGSNTEMQKVAIDQNSRAHLIHPISDFFPQILDLESRKVATIWCFG